MFDYGQMMGLSDLGPQPDQFSDEEMGGAIFGRDQFIEHKELHQDYTQQNPYADGNHGSWLEGQASFYEGMGAMRDMEATDPNAGLDMPIEDDDMSMDDLDMETDELLEDEMALDDDSDEFQAR